VVIIASSCIPILSQVFRRVNWRFCDLYSAVILRQWLLCSRSLLCNRDVWSGAALSGLAMSGLAISAPPNKQQTNKYLRSAIAIVLQRCRSGTSNRESSRQEYLRTSQANDIRR